MIAKKCITVVTEYHSGQYVRSFDTADSAEATVYYYSARGFDVSETGRFRVVLTSGRARVEVFKIL
jgi:hypothetical protein